VFGLNSELVGRPFVRAGSSIIYAVSSLAVVHLLVDRQQRIYNQHSSKISCLAYSGSRELVASGE